MPGTVLDEGTVEPQGNRHALGFDPRRASIQFPFIDTVDHATGEPVYADTIVFTCLFEATGPDGKVWDAVRVILRGDKLFNPRGMFGAEGMPPLQHGSYGEDADDAPPPGHPAWIPIPDEDCREPGCNRR
jgi:hypothetical protein